MDLIPQPLGVIQRKMLDEMARQGGSWPEHWVLPHDKRKVMESLCRRGLVKSVRDPDTGRQIYRLAKETP